MDSRIYSSTQTRTPAGETPHAFALTLSAPGGQGVAHAVTRLLHEAGCDIVDLRQFADTGHEQGSGLFFMRVQFQPPAALADTAALERLVAEAGRDLGLSFQVHDLRRGPRTLILAGPQGHCLNDLLFRHASGQLPLEVAAVASNHAAHAHMVDGYGLPYHHLPLASDGGEQAKQDQERRIHALVEQERVDLVVLARYMQVLSPELCRRLHGRVINIHHSFLPSFKGARPYLQAHGRGVKLIGATAHYVTAELDDGPIIEQDVARVDHGCPPRELAEIGRDVECLVLARAVRWHCERRVLINGARTVVFR